MNTRQLKLLIKESVREVIKEELSEILKEAVLNNSKTKQLVNEDKSFSFNSNDVINKPSNNSELRRKMNEMYGIGSNLNQSKLTNKVILEQPVNEGESKPNPYLKFFAQTAENFTPQDRANLRNIENS